MHEETKEGNTLEVLALIPARGGSKGLPRKNLVPLGGMPLIVHTIQGACASRYVTRVVVTTDDEEIAAVASEAGAETPFLRPADLATDTAPIVPALQHALRWLEQHEAYAPPVVVYLEPTVPLRIVDDIDQPILQLIQTDADTVVALCETEHHPFYLRRLEGDRVIAYLDDQAPSAYITRQELAPVYRVNGSVIVVKREVLLMKDALYGPDTRGYIMPRHRSIEIDTPLDLRFAELLIQVQRAEAVL